MLYLVSKLQLIYYEDTEVESTYSTQLHIGLPS